ncbi:MAG: M20/M25/M40 family metallo-hydrolase [Gammaproteobacteria bacterium]|jgi:acetylornithine deacetylase/succinyl-diaminopimelate desuccinylase-like protein
MANRSTSTNTKPIDKKALSTTIDAFWEQHIIPTLTDYIAIPCLSIDFDPNWQQHGYMDQVEALALEWLQRHKEPQWQIHHQRIPGKTPLIIVEVPGDSEHTIMLYGHLDKQPEMEGWFDGYGPWQPVVHEGKLYGRGGADDGYALFAAIAAIKAMGKQNLPHSRLVILIEFSEESGSPDLPPYLEKYQTIIGSPDLVIALDSGAGDYERLWSTTSLRGMLSCSVSVQVLKEATHSGIASGIVPSSMRIMRQLLDRLENADSGEILLPSLHTAIPEQRRQQIDATAAVLGESLQESFSLVDGLQTVSDDPSQLLLNNTWKPTLCVVGQDGMPTVKQAGNVLRAYTTLKLAFRLPPNLDYRTAQQAIQSTLTADPPYNATVTVNFDQGGNGWDAPPLASWLQQANSEASLAFYDNDAQYFGLGASIPFMAMLGEQYPAAQFLITGVLGPKSNAHGPNEFLHISYAKKLTSCVAYILARQFELNHQPA